MLTFVQLTETNNLTFR